MKNSCGSLPGNDGNPGTGGWHTGHGLRGLLVRPVRRHPGKFGYRDRFGFGPSAGNGNEFL